MVENVLKIILISVLLTAIIVVFILFFYLLRLIKVRIRLKAKTYTDFNKYSQSGEIVFLGDSLTEFYNLGEFFHNIHPYNRGIASDTTDGILSRLFDNVIVLKPRKVFLQIGTNDFASRKTRSIFRIANNIEKILAKLETALADTKIYLISLYPVNPKARFLSRMFTGPRKNKIILELNSLLREKYENSKITYIDMYPHLADENGNLKKDYTTEGLHISFQGYEKITEILLPYLEE